MAVSPAIPATAAPARRLQTRLLAGSALCAALAGAAFVGGTPGSAAGRSGASAAAPPAPAVAPAPADLGRLAALSGCALRPGTANADFRQAVCTSPAGGRVAMVVFTRQTGLEQWKAEAESYGRYLVGPRWAVGGDPAALARLRLRLGGVLEGSTAHLGHPG
ncbi:hypothetical protein [Peterkaempfera griseoplana]|uniref:hypothetical protein n=1 Tax=Peterkaempfera griseoplana TaxID=66896 RepID=UPI0006E3ACA0|nr:hypothetical protein [Peterkaempfera griseoplana]